MYKPLAVIVIFLFDVINEIISNFSRLASNAKLIAQKKQIQEANLQKSLRQLQEVNVEFRTMDKDINTIRPQLMKLQRNKDEYTR